MAQLPVRLVKYTDDKLHLEVLKPGRSGTEDDDWQEANSTTRKKLMDEGIIDRKTWRVTRVWSNTPQQLRKFLDENVFTGGRAATTSRTSRANTPPPTPDDDDDMYDTRQPSSVRRYGQNPNSGVAPAGTYNPGFTGQRQNRSGSGQLPAVVPNAVPAGSYSPHHTGLSVRGRHIHWLPSIAIIVAVVLLFVFVIVPNGVRFFNGFKGYSDHPVKWAALHQVNDNGKESYIEIVDTAPKTDMVVVIILLGGTSANSIAVDLVPDVEAGSQFLLKTCDMNGDGYPDIYVQKAGDPIEAFSPILGTPGQHGMGNGFHKPDPKTYPQDSHIMPCA